MEKLIQILKDHKEWLENSENGKRADLRGAKQIIRIESQYPYQAHGYYCKNKKRVRLGCFDRTVEEWDSNFWNNDEEFPENSPQGKNRFMIYTFIKEWLIANEVST